MVHSNLIIETERLLLRPFTLNDIKPSHEMNKDAEVSKFTGDGGVVSEQEIERRIKEDVLGDYIKHGFGRLAVELKSEKKFIGFAGLKYLEDLKEVDLGYRFMSKYWRKGIATEAAIACVNLGFTALNLNKLIAMVLPQNTASINVLNKLKFKFTKNIIEDGETANLYTLYKTSFNEKLH